MALKCLVLLAMLKFAYPDVNVDVNVNVHAQPDPDPDVNVNVNSDVDAENTGATDTSQAPNLLEGNVSGCMFGKTGYAEGALIENSCMMLQCIRDAWNYIGKIRGDCGNCTAKGDPHFIPFDQHLHSPASINGDPTHGYMYSYQGKGTYALTQDAAPDSSAQLTFGVNSTFMTCHGQQSCVNSVTYYEPGLTIKMELPAPVNNCNGANDPLCQIKVYVGGQLQTFDNYVVKSFGAQHGTVLAFMHNHIGDDDNLNCGNIVGTTGISVSLCTVKGDYAWLYVWALPSLKGNLYGLCDKYQGIVQTVYTKHDGTGVEGKTQTQIDAFAQSWGYQTLDKNVASSNVLIYQTLDNNFASSNVLGKCSDPKEMASVVAGCALKNALYCIISGKAKCAAKNAGCAYDMCHTEVGIELLALEQGTLTSYSHGMETNTLIEISLSRTCMPYPQCNPPATPCC